jgi:large subunit ribosomal protein L24
MAATMKIKKGDTVQVLAGKDRGKQGRVIDALPRQRRVIVENLNLVKRHRKPQPIRDVSRMGGSQMTPGGIFDKPSPIDISNVMLVCPTCREATRVGVHVKEIKGETVRVRYCKRPDCGQEIDR